MTSSFRNSALIALAFIALLWVLELADRALGLQLYRLGVYPHAASGLAGIVCAPLVHGSWNHLLSNSFALLILLTALFYGYPRSARPALAFIYLLSGLGVWLFARQSYHFGASGLTHGMMFYIFASGILRRDRLSIALSLIVFFIHGSMIWSIFPQEPDISYEYHFFGAAAGLVATFLFARRDPPPAEKHYDWEGEEDPDNSDEDPDSGNEARGYPG